MRRGEYIRAVDAYLKQGRGTDEERRIARAELDAEADAEVAEPEPLPANVTQFPNEYLSLDEIEAERLRLAKDGKPHGYDALAKSFGKSSRSTIQRRYKGRQPPGAAIAGVCDARPHTHG
jgi:hypothetical protein